MAEWKGKPLVIDHKRNVDSEMIECGISAVDAIEVLENGAAPVKRGKGIIERWMRAGWHVTMVVVEDCGDYWLLRHVTKVRSTKKLTRLMRGENP